jgi:hypothetical protein
MFLSVSFNKYNFLKQIVFIFFVISFAGQLLSAPKIKINEKYDDFDGVGSRQFNILTCGGIPLQRISGYFRQDNSSPIIYLNFKSYSNFEYHETVEFRFEGDPKKEVFKITTKNYDTKYYPPVNKYSNVHKYHTNLTYFDEDGVFEKIADKYYELAENKEKKDKIVLIYRSRSSDNTILYTGQGGCAMRADRAKILKQTYKDSLRFMKEN